MFFKSLDKKSDEELMRLVQQGNSHAMTELYQRYSRNLLRYFYRMLWKEEPKAQDFLHDLFVKVIENASRFNPDQKFSTWLYSVAHNMCKNEYRKQAFRQAMDGRIIPERLFEDITHRQMEAQEFQQALDEALDKLSEDEKHLFMLRHEMEMPLEEIAQVLNCPLGTVKSRLFYVKRKLATMLYKYQTVKK
ncbi:MAG TPA: sigma-70 family RNA polymerase sigma factor [Ohtaekwangia sp.]